MHELRRRFHAARVDVVIVVNGAGTLAYDATT
jgi:hypothetical protein